MHSNAPALAPTDRQGVHPSAVLAALRAATRARHQVLDSNLPIARPGARHQDYVRHLRALHGWLEPLNGSLWSLAWPETLDAAVRGNKIKLIEHDLAAGAAMGLHPAGVIPACTAVPQLCALDAYAIGVAYVIEGSQLGGAILARRFIGGSIASFAADFAASPAAGAFSYLTGYGDATGPMWKRFLSFMDEAVATPQQIDHAVRGACDAFDTLIAWMNVQHLITTGDITIQGRLPARS